VASFRSLSLLSEGIYGSAGSIEQQAPSVFIPNFSRNLKFLFK